MEIQVHGNLTTTHKVDFQRQPPELSYEKAICKNLQNSQESSSVGVSFLIKLHAWDLQLYWKRNSDTDVLLWI